MRPLSLPIVLMVNPCDPNFCFGSHNGLSASHRWTRRISFDPNLDLQTCWDVWSSLDSEEARDRSSLLTSSTVLETTVPVVSVDRTGFITTGCDGIRRAIGDFNVSKRITSTASVAIQVSLWEMRTRHFRMSGGRIRFVGCRRTCVPGIGRQLFFKITL